MFALTAVAENKGVDVGLVVGSLVEIHNNVAAEFVTTEIKSVLIGLSGKGKGVQISRGGGGENSL